MNESLASSYISEILVHQLFGKRFHVRDSSACHISNRAEAELKRRKIDMAVDPGGGGVHEIRATRRCVLNKPFKDRL